MNSRYDLATNDSIPSGLINKVRQFVFLCLSLFLAALVLIFAGQFLVLYLANPSSEFHALFLDNLVWIQWFVGLTSVFLTLLFIRFVYQGNTLLRQFASSAIDGELTGFFEVNEPLAQNILNSAVDGIIIINQQGIIQHFNPAAQKLFGYESKEVLGHNINKLMPSPNREMHDHYLARYLTSGNAKIIGTIRELEGQRKDGTVFPMELAVSEVALGQRRFFTGIIHDITRQKEIRSRLAVQNTVTNILSQANSLEEATPKILSEICSHLGWSVGELWLPDDRKAQLNLVTQWYASEEPGKEFAEVSQDTSFAKGIGLPGRVWSSAQPAWIVDVTLDEDFVRAEVAKKAGLRTAFAFPILLNDEVMGVLVFLQEHQRSPYTNFEDLFLSVGHQLGQFLARKRSEVESRERESRFQDLADNAPALIWMTDATSQFVYVSRSWADYTGRSAKDAQGEGWWDFLHQEDREITREKLQSALATLSSFEVEYRLRASDGSYGWFFARGNPRFDDQGVFLGLIGTCIDITERRSSQQQLLVSGARFRAILEAALDCIITIDHHGHVLEFNPAAEQTFGYRRDNILGKPMGELIVPPQFRQAHQEGMKKYLETGYGPVLGQRIEIVAMRSDGSEFPVELAISVVKSNGPPVFTAYLRDITERQKSEKTLRETMALQNAILDSAPYTIISTDVDGTIRTFNRTAERLLGYSAEEVVGKTTPALIHDPDEIRQNAERLSQELNLPVPPSFETFVAKVRHGGIDQREWSYVRKDGTRFPVLLSVSSLLDSQGATTGYLGVGVDISERKQNEADIRAKQNLLDSIRRAQSRFIASATISDVFDELLADLLTLTESEYGFIGEVIYPENGTPFLKTYSITNIAWDATTQLFYQENAANGLEFYNLKTLFGHVITSNEAVISNQPHTDARSGGLPEGHPALNTFLGIPFNHGSQLVGMVGIANRAGGYDESMIEYLQPFLSTCSNLIQGYRIDRSRQHTERQLQAERLRFQHLFENAPIAIWEEDMSELGAWLGNLKEGGVVDLHAHLESHGEDIAKALAMIKIQNLNTAAVVQNGARNKSELLENLGRLFTEHTQKDFIAELIGLWEGKSSIEFESHSITLDGKPLDNLIRIFIPEKEGQQDLSQVIVTGTDITERKRAEQALKFTSFSLEHAVDAVFFIGSDGSLFKVNAAAQQSLGYTSEELLSMTIHDVDPEFSPNDWQTHWQRIKQEGSITFESVHRTKSGKLFPVEVTANYLQFDGKDYNCAFARDITDRKKAEAKLRQAIEEAQSANRSKTEFLANMSHEVRTPMSAILGYSELLLEPSLAHEERVQALQSIRRNGHHLLQIINDILDLSKIEAGKLELEILAYSPWQIVLETLSNLGVRADEKGVTLESRVIGRVPPQIATDPTRLRQILVNFVSNAIKFTEAGKKVVIRCMAEKKELDNLGWIILEVEDQGIGIPPEKIETLFLPFQQVDSTMTRKYGGTGLGLSISQKLAHALGGTITVQSQLGMGSIFTLRLPLENSLTEEWVDANDLSNTNGFASVPRPFPALSRKAKILLAEDSKDNQDIIKYFLQKFGLEVEVVENGRLAVQKAIHGDFQIILMDMQMPELDGYGAASSLREQGCHLPIIALTAHAMHGDREKCLRAGCTDYLTKPIDSQRLFDMLSYYLQIADALDQELQQPRPSATSLDEVTHQAQHSEKDEGLYAITKKYVGNLTSRLVEMREARNAENWSKLYTLAHQTKGASGTYGFSELSETAMLLEEALREQQEADLIDELLEDLAQQISSVQVSFGIDENSAT